MEIDKHATADIDLEFGNFVTTTSSSYSAHTLSTLLFNNNNNNKYTICIVMYTHVDLILHSLLANVHTRRQKHWEMKNENWTRKNMQKSH